MITALTLDYNKEKLMKFPLYAAFAALAFATPAQAFTLVEKCPLGNIVVAQPVSAHVASVTAVSCGASANTSAKFLVTIFEVMPVMTEYAQQMCDSTGDFAGQGIGAISSVTLYLPSIGASFPYDCEEE